MFTGVGGRVGVSLGIDPVPVTRLLFDGGPCLALLKITEGLVGCCTVRCCPVVGCTVDSVTCACRVRSRGPVAGAIVWFRDGDCW
jgi:hypothetical protein